MFLDLDGFKGVNDAYGHQVGDLLLVEVANRIRGTVRARDTIARLGGDEFVLLVDSDEPTGAATVAEKLISAIAQPFLVEGHELRISASVGLAIYSGAEEHADLLMNADAAMYHAKAIGRNCFCFFEASMNANVHEQLEMLQNLRQAVDRRELVLYYQPKFDAESRKLLGAEALLRWQHPTRGLIQPDEFIPLAEKSGLIVPIGEWALNEACRQMREWLDSIRESRDWTIAVNLSALQFSHPGLMRLVRDTLHRNALEPSFLTVEITESTAMRDVDSSMAILQQIYSMVVNISIDDFGTGYSSLLYLKRLPATELKIDRGFVRELSHDGEDAAIVSAIIALGQTLNLRVVAEGVETTAQQEFLTDLGCDSLQGFLLGQPMPPDQFREAAMSDTIVAVRTGVAEPGAWKLIAQTI